MPKHHDPPLGPANNCSQDHNASMTSWPQRNCKSCRNADRLYQQTLLGVSMWNTMWKTCEKCVKIGHFSHVFHMHFTQVFHLHVKFCIYEIYVKMMWSDVIPFAHIFTYTSHGVSNRLSHANPHLNSHIFSYTSREVSHGLSHVLNHHWMAKHLQFHMLLIYTLFSRTLHMGFLMSFHM